MGLPDNTSAALFQRLDNHPTIRLVRVTREGEAFALASGLWVGGARPVVVIQNTGLLESGDALRGTALRMGIPLPFLVTYRGYASLQRCNVNPLTATLTRDMLVRPDLDSVAVLTERTLTAWCVPYHTVDLETGTKQVSSAFAQAHRETRPVAALLCHALR